MKIYVGAYAASAGLDEAGETALYAGLAALDVAGLEQPFFGSLHRRDEGWLTAQIRPGWSLVITTLPGAMDKLNDDRHFGLASADPDGRKRALDFAEAARLSVEKLHHALGRRARARARQGLHENRGRRPGRQDFRRQDADRLSDQLGPFRG